MITISLCMIVKNEEDNLERCLSSVSGAVDEIIIADTGSTDKTKEIAKKFTSKIYDFKWIDDFSAARNFSYSQAEMDYIMWLDADDIIKPDDLNMLIALKGELPPDVDGIMMKYNTAFDANGNPTFSYYRERISKRSKDFKWVEPIHEYLQIYGNIINVDICITHAKVHRQLSDRNIKIYEKNLADGITLSPRGMYYYARELKDHKRYEEAVNWYDLFLESKLGWVEDNITACGDMAACYMAEGRKKEAFLSLVRSFSYDTPRAEICCRLGYYFMEMNRFNLAAYWFETALKMDIPKNARGFIQPDCYSYIPSIELVVCYDKMKNYKKAYEYNEKAAEYKPYSSAVKYNREYFDDPSHNGRYLTNN